MEKQAAVDLLKCFLEKRKTPDIDCHKELQGLVAYGVAKGCFTNPDTLFEEDEWRKFGDILFEEMISENKTAKKLAKPWRAVTNALAIHRVEQKVAAAATQRLGKTLRAAEEADPYPLPPSVQQFTMKAPAGGEEWARPSAPPLPLETPGEKATVEGGNKNPFLEDMRIESGGSERVGLWAKIAGEALREGDVGAATELVGAFPVVYSPPNAQGQITVTMTNLDWKILTQLRATVNESGIRGEPTKQMLDYLWSTNVLLPGDIRNIMKLILTQHQILLFNAHWQSACQEAVAVQRQPGDPLHGVTLDELLGVGAYNRLEAQALMGPDKAKAAMTLARRALDQIREPGGMPSYMSIKQGRDEAFGTFIDRVAAAIQVAGLPEYLKGPILKQCALQNCNQTSRNVLNTLPSTWTIEEALDRLSQIPIGSQALLVDAIRKVGESISQGLQASQSQVFAALAPLQSGKGPRSSGRPALRCYRCGIVGHMKRQCGTANVWCPHCQSNSHTETVCRRKAQGNGRASGNRRPATTQKAAFPSTATTTTRSPAETNPFTSSQPPEGASGWIWQPQ
uniref:Gag polyprotein n=1 Tax=Retroviridae sp. TaxID=2681591 RepID=A0A7D5U512_9RETR|nr:MAG: gag polyprotein [Retroviridae sp.]